LEEKRPDALEVAEKTNEKGKAQEKCQVVLKLLFYKQIIFFSTNYISSYQITPLEKLLC
jgi:hypothetical protein